APSGAARGNEGQLAAAAGGGLAKEQPQFGQPGGKGGVELGGLKAQLAVAGERQPRAGGGGQVGSAAEHLAQQGGRQVTADASEQWIVVQRRAAFIGGHALRLDEVNHPVERLDEALHGIARGVGVAAHCNRGGGTGVVGGESDG